MLGIVIGVAAVIALMSVGKGAEADIISSIEALGSDLVFINPGAITEKGVKSAAGSATTLTLEDATAISEQVPHIKAVAPSYIAGLQIVVGGENMRVQVAGITPEYQQAYNLQTVEGNFISGYDYQRGAKV
jgi:putative ABC transport system permease protein